MKSKFNIIYESIMNDLKKNQSITESRRKKQFVGMFLNEFKSQLMECDDGTILGIETDFGGQDQVITDIFVDTCPWPEEYPGKVLTIQTRNMNEEYDDEQEEYEDIKDFSKEDVLRIINKLPDNAPILIYMGEEDTGVITHVDSTNGLIEGRLLSREPAFQ